MKYFRIARLLQSLNTTEQYQRALQSQTPVGTSWANAPPPELPSAWPRDRAVQWDGEAEAVGALLRLDVNFGTEGGILWQQRAGCMRMTRKASLCRPRGQKQTPAIRGTGMSCRRAEREGREAACSVSGRFPVHSWSQFLRDVASCHGVYEISLCISINSSCIITIF